MLIRASLLALAASVAFADDDPVQLSFVNSGAADRIGGYVPQELKLSATKPESLKKVPEGLVAPLYAVLPVAGTGGAVFHVVIDEPDGKPSRVWADTNGDGDITQDTPVRWAAMTAKGRAGGMKGELRLNIGTADAPMDVAIGIYRFDKADPAHANMKDTLLYYSDYFREGQGQLGGKSFQMMLADLSCSGDFRGRPLDASDTKVSSGAMLLIDVNGNGKYDIRGERFDVRKPFKVAGATWEVAEMAIDGATFKFVKSAKPADEVAPPPDHSVGKTITAFEAKTMDGKDVKFPSDYKGRIVLLDFWATWCGPCMGEVPSLVAAYARFKDRGFDVLGMSLDREGSEQTIKDVMAKKQMTWPQIYDGKFFESPIAQLYGISAIPAPYLVDGDTGEILAVDDSLRGGELEKTVEAALAKKGK